VLREQKARLYIIRRCVVMLLFYHDWFISALLFSDATIGVLFIWFSFLARLNRGVCLHRVVQKVLVWWSWVLQWQECACRGSVVCWHPCCLFARSQMKEHRKEKKRKNKVKKNYGTCQKGLSIGISFFDLYCWRLIVTHWVAT
jgi:hypothetical protein